MFQDHLKSLFLEIGNSARNHLFLPYRDPSKIWDDPSQYIEVFCLSSIFTSLSDKEGRSEERRGRKIKFKKMQIRWYALYTPQKRQFGLYRFDEELRDNPITTGATKLKNPPCSAGKERNLMDDLDTAGTAPSRSHTALTLTGSDFQDYEVKIIIIIIIIN